MEVTILMPCLNEEETIKNCILKAMHSIDKHGLDAEILVGDNGSSDNSAEIAQSLGARVIQVQEKGYGCALRAGISQAKGKYIIMGDADDSYDFGDIYSFISRLREGYDLVMGNRFKGGIEKGAMPFLHKYLGNPVLSYIGRLFFKIPIGDFHCGLRGMNKEAMTNAGLCTTGMEFASEMVVKSALNKLKITEVPIKLYKDGRSKAPHIRTWSDGWRHLRFLLLYSPKWLFLYPGLFMILLGIMVTALLFNGPVTIKNITFDVHTMLYFSLLSVVGFQLVAFYFQSKVFAIKESLLNNEVWLQRFEKYFSLEKGIVVGGLILICGIAFTVYCFSIWGSADFGDLDPKRVLRLAIPSVSSLLLGIQLIFNSFFISLLMLKTTNQKNIFIKKTEEARFKEASIY